MDRVGGKRASRRSRCQEPETAVPVGRGWEVAGSPRVPWDPPPQSCPVLAALVQPRYTRPAAAHLLPPALPAALTAPRPPAAFSLGLSQYLPAPGPLHRFSPGLATVLPSLPASPVSSSPASCFDPDGRPSQPSPCPAGHRASSKPASAQGGDNGSCSPGVRSLLPGDSQTPLRPPVLSQALQRARAGDVGPGLGRTHGILPEASPREGRWPVWPLRSQAGEEHPGGPGGGAGQCVHRSWAAPRHPRGPASADAVELPET